MILHLADGLREAGESPIVVTERPGWMTERAEAASHAVWILGEQRGVDVGWMRRTAQRLRSEAVDVFHAHEFGMNIFGALAARVSGVQALNTVHGRHWVAERPRRAWAYRVLRRAGVPIVAVSDDLARFLADGFGLPSHSLQRVYNGIPVKALPNREARLRRRPEARREAGLPEDGALVVAVGNLYPVKDHATLLRSLPELPGVRVAIAGRGDQEDSLRRLAHELGVADRVHLLGLRDDVPRLLTAADVYVQPSLSEGLPMALLEAMATGLPAVVTRVGGMPEAVLEGETGYVVSVGAPRELAEALARVLAQPGSGVALGEAGHRRVAEAFSLDAMVRGYLALYGTS